MRNEYFDNALSLSPTLSQSPVFASVHEQDYFRFRGRVWASLFPTNDVVSMSAAAQPREFLKRSTMDTYFEQDGHPMALRNH